MRTFFLILTATTTALAQTALTGAIRISITDESGAALGASRVELASDGLGNSLSAVSDENGVLTFSRLKPAFDYQITVTRGGFRSWSRTAVEVLSGETANLTVALSVASRSDSIVVTEMGPGVSLDSAELSSSAGAGVLNQLPANGRVVTRFAMIDARVRNSNALSGDGSNLYRLSINGNIFRDSQHRLDGNTNYDTLFNNIPLQRVPLSAVQEFRVLTNQFNAEHGSTSAGLTITTTKSGGDQVHGELFLLGRPSGIQARPPLAALRIPNQLIQEGGAVGGPIRQSRTHLFGSYERTDQARGSFISSGNRGFHVGSYRDNQALVKIDHRFRDSHWATLRLNGHRDSNTNANDRVGGLNQPSMALFNATQGFGVQASDTQTWGAAVNELRAGYVNSVPSSSSPLNPGLVVSRPGFSNEGAATFSTNRAEVFQFANQFSWQKGNHALKFGGDFIRRKVRDRQFDLFGTYTFAGGLPTVNQQPILYTQRFGVANLRYGQTQWAGFAQDSWRAHPHLTLNLGVRFDYQSLLDDYNNFGPRVGFVWNPKGDAKTVIRGGFGLYYDQPFFHGLTQRFLLNALDAPFATFSIGPNHPAFPTFPATYPTTVPPPGLALAPRNIVLRGDKLLSPYTTQVTFGVQRELPGRWILSVDGTRSLSVKQFLQYDRNASAPFPRSQPGQTRSIAQADRSRPFFDASRGVSIYQSVPVREVRMTTNGNTANYHALTFNVNRRFGGRYFAGLSYNWASAMNNITDDHLGANPQEWSDVQRGERAPSDFLQRHRLAANGGVQLPWQISVSAMIITSSGLPVNALTGADNNGDGLNRDRPAGFGRNLFRGTPHRSVDLAITKRIAVSEALSLDLRAEGYNVLNKQNYYTFNNVYGQGASPVSTFLRPVGGVANVDPARQFTFAIKLIF
ncbi:MAG: TonB-dependent receptor [Acidobacteria bacterium]|nr:TonB-dependent receptor [Acidobacteriota bacterium]